jgi:Tol biopolymer transport system component
MDSRARLLRAALLALPATSFACNGEDLSGPTSGTLEITTMTTGAEPDPDGYTVQFDSEQPRAIGASATLESTDVTPGNHTVLLTGLAPNCVADGENPKAVRIVAGETIAVPFQVSCTASTGSLTITTSTTGTEPDPDGYRVALDRGSSVPVQSTGDVTLENLAPGTRSVELVGLASNCSVDGANPRTIAVTVGQRANLDFAVSCPAPDRSRIAFSTMRNGSWDIYLMNPDGSGLTNLTRSALTDPYNLIWSPDGSRIAFQDLEGMDIGVIKADGTELRNLTNSTPIETSDRAINEENSPAWSPDSRKIAFDADRGPLSAPSNWDIFAVDVDGSGLTNLTESPLNDWQAAWSPDGRIAYIGGCGSSICIMNSDGSGTTPVAGPQMVGPPSWSPDGRKIMLSAFVGGQNEIHVVNVDGTGERALVTGGQFSFSPVWSPDGTRIAFAAADIEVMNADGSGRRRLTNSGRYPNRLTWSPDGTRIAYVSAGIDPYNGFDTDIYVTDVERGGETNLTNNPAPDDYPAWSPN